MYKNKSIPEKTDDETTIKINFLTDSINEEHSCFLRTTNYSFPTESRRKRPSDFFTVTGGGGFLEAAQVDPLVVEVEAITTGELGFKSLLFFVLPESPIFLPRLRRDFFSKPQR
ncbi:unnamed protein product, partial [Mesorhabditis belari]|uniref:Uncharacterized protein n=1 Tax=Mesorhabditis belari TaxID=2138241 RepID=A0AAF3J3X5_9BILA